MYAVSTRGYHHGDLRRTLLESAIRVLEEEGSEALSLRALAKEAGVSPMAPYRHFAEKAALLAAISVHGFGLLRERLAAADREGPGGLIGQGVAYVLFAIEHPELFRLMFGRPPDWRESASEDLANRPDTVLGAFMKETRAAFPPDEVELAMLSLWSFAHGLASLIVDLRLDPFPSDVEALTREVTTYFARRFVGLPG